MSPCEKKLSNDLHTLMAKVEAFRELMNERDVRYMEMFSASDRAVVSALAAQKEGTESAFVASEKAIVKAEEAQKAYNVAHNDLIRKMDEREKVTMPRTETESRFLNLGSQADSRFSNIEEKIANIRATLNRLEGSGAGMEKLWGWIAFAIMSIIAVAGIFVR